MKFSKKMIGLWMTLSIVLTMGCVEEFEANVNEIPNEGLVVEGSIISDSTMVFQLSKTLPLDISTELRESFMDVDAELSVKGSDGTTWVGLPLGEGQYQVEIGTLQADVEYHLEILFDGDIYQSSPQKPLASVGIERMSFTQSDLRDEVDIFLNTHKGEEPQYCLWSFEEDWEVRATYVTTALYDPVEDRIVHYDHPPVAQGWSYSRSNQILLGTSESNVENCIVKAPIKRISYWDDRLSVLYSIRVQQRNLTPLEYTYYQMRLKYSSDMGGLFSPQPTELPTNITCSNPSKKVIGYVGCNMSISKHQFYIHGEDVSYSDYMKCEIRDDLTGTNQSKYSYGYQVVKTPAVYGWVMLRCVDVRAKGADPRGRPSWWPNPYLFDENGF